jgi:hypothetical protein
MISKPIAHSSQTMHLSYVENSTISKERNELPFDPRHLEVPLFVPKMISEPMACSSQSVHQSLAEIKTVSKWTEMSFHLTQVT